MKRALPVPLLLLCLTSVPAQAGRPAPQACQDDFTECREDCSMDYGASTRTRPQLGVCVSQCQQKLEACGERHHTSRDTGLAPGALERPRERDPAMDEPVRRDVYRTPKAPEPRPALAEPSPAPQEDEDSPSPPPAPARPEPQPAVASEPQAEPLAQPAVAREELERPAPTAVAEPAADEEEEPLPPPKPKVAQPTPPSRPKPPPEPKKYDISEWDPNED